MISGRPDEKGIVRMAEKEKGTRIQGQGIYLRPITVEDTDLIVLWRNKDYVRHNFIYQAPFTKEGHLNWLKTRVETGQVIQFMICEEDTDKPVGSVYLRDVDMIHRKAEYGIFIGEEGATGKGYGTQAAKLIVDYAFQEVKLHKVMLRVLAENGSARRSYEKAGFVQEAYLKEEVFLENQYKDVVLMARLNERELQKQRFVIIGANEFQTPLIIRAAEKGLETHVFAWEQGAVGREYAHYFYPISITEKDEILEKCRELQPVGIASIGSDLAMLTVNYIADKLGLCANSLACTEISTNKYKMRQAFADNGDPSPRFALSDEKEKIKDFSYPVVVKPTDRSGSRGIMRLESEEGLWEAIEKAGKFSFEGKAIVEEFIRGKEYSVEFISYQGQHTFLALTEKFTTGAPCYIETGHREPAQVSQETLAKIRETVAHALDSLKITCGASHAEVMVTEDGRVTIVEIGARMGGDCIGSDLVKLSTGYDFVGMVIDTACGRKPKLERVCEPRPVSVHFIMGETDLDRLKELQEKKPDSIYTVSRIEAFDHQVTDSGSRFGYYIMYEDC